MTGQTGCDNVLHFSAALNLEYGNPQGWVELEYSNISPLTTPLTLLTFFKRAASAYHKKTYSRVVFGTTLWNASV